MVSTWNSDSTAPFTALKNMVDDNSSQDGLTFIDFLPKCLRPAGFITDAIYETLWSLVDQVNVWLRANPQWEIKSCESVAFSDEGKEVTSNMTYYEYGELPNNYVRGLRLWIRKTESNREVGQKIGYINVAPLKTKEGGIFTSPVYENLDDLINRFNALVRSQPIPGRIISIETEKMTLPYLSEMMHPDRSSWEEKKAVKVSKMFLYALRIFFEFTEEHYEEIGIIDFIPEVLETYICKDTKYELFSSIVNRASQWCSRQTDVRICNVQSLEIKIRNGTDINTQKMTFLKPASWMVSYVRILRVAYAKSQFNMKTDSDFITQLTCKTFVPVQLTRETCNTNKFETIDETKARISAWIKATGAQVVSVETTARLLDGVTERKYGHEASSSYYSSRSGGTWIYHIRVYLNGVYPEPSPSKLPPVPEIQDKTCTIL